MNIIALYEELRAEVIGDASSRFSSRGFGLLVQRGFTAWAETQASLLTDSELPRVKPHLPINTHPILPGEIRAQATQILARMALNCLTELVA